MNTPSPDAVPPRETVGRAAEPPSEPRGSRWRCPQCGSANVQIRLPVWFNEYQDGELVEMSIDSEADPEAYYCADCYSCEKGSPVLVELRAESSA